MDRFPVTQVVIARSVSLQRFILLVHLSGVAAIMLAALPWSIRLPALCALALSYRRAWHDHIARRGNAVTAIEADAKRGWRVRQAGGQFKPVRLLTDNLVLTWLTVLRFQFEDGAAQHVALLPDNVPAEQFRRIRVLVRTGSGTDRRDNPAARPNSKRARNELT